MSKTVLELREYAVSLDTPQGEVEAVRGVDLAVKEGEILCIIGESGCGKTVLCQSILKLLPRTARIKSGSVILNGENITDYTEKQMRPLRGNVASMVFQDPMMTLNPTIPVGKQITEAILRHKKMSREDARARGLELLTLVGISDPEEMFDLQPHFFSGGMRQRCVLAIALAMSPKVILADEPTTALDVTVAAKMLDLLMEIRDKTGVAIVFISHDLGTVARIADRVAVMYAGKIVEIGTAEEVYQDPRHPYTWALLSALPSMVEPGGTLKSIPGMPPRLINPPKGDAFAPRNEYALPRDFEEMPPMFPVTQTHFAATWLLAEGAPQVDCPVKIADLCEFRKNSVEKSLETCMEKFKPESERARDAEIIFRVQNFSKTYRINKNFSIHAVKRVSFDIQKGEVLGLVGASGCGKSTIAKSLAGIYAPTEGTIEFEGITVAGDGASTAQKKKMQKCIQIVFQDSAAALNPRMKVERLIAEPLYIQKKRMDRAQVRSLVLKVLQEVGLDETDLTKYPGELSGGERQRVAIARSLIVDPQLIIADEPVASMDVSLQAQILNLFKKLQRERGFSLLFIAHDLAAVRYISDRVAVMKKGEIVEIVEL